MLGWWICTHCRHGHVICCCIYMTTMYHHRVLYVSNRRLAISPELLFCAFWFWFSRFPKEISRHDSNDELIILAYMQHSKPHITFYREKIFLIWGGRIDSSLESTMLILLATSFTYLISPSSGGLTTILWSYRIDTCINSFETNFGSEWTSTENLRQSLAVGDWRTWGCCIIQL